MTLCVMCVKILIENIIRKGVLHVESQTNGNLLFEVQTKLTFERYQTLNLTVNKKAFRRNLIFEIIVSVIFAAVNLWLFAVSGNLFYLFLAFFFPAFFVVYNVILRALLKRKFRKVWQSMPDKDGEFRYRFYDDHIEASGPNGDSHYTYDQVYCVNETKDMYIIRVSFVHALLIEKASISPENAAFIRSLAPEKPVRTKAKKG